ncbi:MAG: hypothetical protein AB7V27_03515 [Candidatus Binatia bacterium]
MRSRATSPHAGAERRSGKDGRQQSTSIAMFTEGERRDAAPPLVGIAAAMACDNVPRHIRSGRAAAAFDVSTAFAERG